MLWSSPLTPEQEENISAFLFELGCVPAGLITPTIVSLIHSEMMESQADRVCDLIAQDSEREFLSQCAEHWRKYKRHAKSDPMYVQLSFKNFD